MSSVLPLQRAPKIVDPLVVVDVETTGLNFSSPILELGIAVVDPKDLWIRATFAAVFPATVQLNTVDPLVVEMHSKNGLWADVAKVNRKVLTSSAIMQSAISFLREFDALNAPMAGSSVHFDRGVLRNQLSGLEAVFHYRNIDVSTLKELVKRWAPDQVWRGGRGIHRVIPDVEDTVAELRHYRRVLGL